MIPAFFGYIDPGSGTLLWQMLASVAFGALFFAGQVWRKLKRFLLRR